MGVREINKKNTLSFIELKQGYSSVSSSNNASGLYKHYKDILQVVSNKRILKNVKNLLLRAGKNIVLEEKNPT